MWFDIGGWWYTCAYMYRRFGVPFGKEWLGKIVEGYVHSAVVPRDPQEEAELAPYFNMVMPVYADKFLGWWKNRSLAGNSSQFRVPRHLPHGSRPHLPELMILLEDAIDIQERHFRLHWVLNLAQFQTSMTFEKMLVEYLGEKHKEPCRAHPGFRRGPQLGFDSGALEDEGAGEKISQPSRRL